MKLNKEDLKDLEGVVYWTSAAKANVEELVNKSNLCTPEELLTSTLAFIEKIDGCAVRILMGENR